MKQLAVYILLAITMSSCLKQTIAGAMLEKETALANGSTITVSYQVNGQQFSKILNDQQNFSGGSYDYSCKKKTGAYFLDLSSSSGFITFWFVTDSLQNKSYVIKGGGQQYLYFNGINGYLRYPTDSLHFTVTSYGNSRRVSGTFSGNLTPAIIGGVPDTYGTPGSVAVTNGSFENVPVFY